MHVVFYGLFSCFLWCLEQWSNVYVKTYISITSGYYFCTTIVSVLTHFGNHNTRTTTFFFSEFIG